MLPTPHLQAKETSESLLARERAELQQTVQKLESSLAIANDQLNSMQVGRVRRAGSGRPGGGAGWAGARFLYCSLSLSAARMCSKAAPHAPGPHVPPPTALYSGGQPTWCAVPDSPRPP